MAAAQALDLRLENVRVNRTLGVVRRGSVSQKDSFELSIEIGAEERLERIELVAGHSRGRAREVSELGRGTRAAYRFIRAQRTELGQPIAKITEDVLLYPLIRTLAGLVHQGAIVLAVSAAEIPTR